MKLTPTKFFIEACKAGRYKEKAWVYSVFGCTKTPAERVEKAKVYDVLRIDDKVYWMSTDGLVEFDNVAIDQPLLTFRERFTITPDDIPNCTKEMETSVGNYFVNWYTIVFPFGSKIDYLEGPITVKRVCKQVAPRIKDDPVDTSYRVVNELMTGNDIYITEYIKYVQATLALAGFAEISVPAATPYTGRTSPLMPKLRAKLLEENKDNLGDLATIAKIEKELIKLDREWIEQDPDKGFLIKDKSFAVARKKQFIMSGAEKSFRKGGPITLIDKPLVDGLDVKSLPASINSLRDGVYNRGSMTALGGEAVKFFQRVLQNVRISMEDCGVDYGVPTDITSDNVGMFTGMWFKTGNGWTELTLDNKQDFVGKKYQRRSPLVCKAPETDFCAMCAGSLVAANPLALSAYGSNLGSTLMYVFMQAMHGTALITREFVISKLIS